MSKEYVLKQDYIIPAGTKLGRAPVKTEYGTPHYEILVGFGRDECASFILDEDILKQNPDLFLELK